MIENIFSEIALLDGIFEKENRYITFFGSARLQNDNIYCKKAYELAKKLANKGFSIVTGGGDGIMQAANKGAYDAGKNSIGINIQLPFEQNSNPYINKGTKLKNLSLRKYALIEHSKAFVVFPGGFGTLDELFEILCLVQTKFREDNKIYLIGIDFWSKLDEFIRDTLVENMTITPNDINLYTIEDDIDIVFNYIINSAK
ncbi:lysine decarboxylase [Campylobacter sputorum subsp. bubulus]|uniref:Cytokinin riboside 5'-monophosphate phosphoribohydrolase n=1 Tax=Campylobacter sputorum subsp. sputorum TaxID=32024 RepID=A0A381DL85_9BACT|nr:TIGR00730 family Rossman fold protein [Campylobacter sputorum]ASM34794.1 putative lysine decarboxylase family protein [Campylobacter sputorum aubsp. sputorum RM3237]KAB0581650.1 TIGR00730 family Rossman fold protein [Campylobacter sputorum subsp. sputorum]QEL04987.1 putative lysine decarboxylase family protein [Campylobacter sputorum subsp. sputorum]SUX10133.1 lysine decarboxylase [Campylobacter sputorum subsp. bubulus]SUX11474.1 lysine decarboxylase [Campylobacter sputorum subsp. sputorum]